MKDYLIGAWGGVIMIAIAVVFAKVFVIIFPYLEAIATALAMVNK